MAKETDLALMCDGAWKQMGVEPFDDNEVETVTEDELNNIMRAA
jgi:hypothetical protein